MKKNNCSQFILRFLFVSTICFFLIFVSAVWADVYQCDGKWTNKPCDGQVAKKLVETEQGLETVDPARGEKRSLLHELTMKALKARDDYQIRTDLASAQNTCTKPGISLEQCQTTAQKIDKDLDEKIDRAAKLANKKKQLELQQEANRLQAERNKIEDNKPSVVVVNRPIIRLPRPREYQQIPQGSGIAVRISGAQVSGSSASGAVSIGATNFTVPPITAPQSQARTGKTPMLTGNSFAEQKVNAKKQAAAERR